MQLRENKYVVILGIANMLRLAACGQLRDISLFAPSWCMLLVQAWKEHVLPLLRQHIATEVDPVLSYILVYHEASLANLLEVRRAVMKCTAQVPAVRTQAHRQCTKPRLGLQMITLCTSAVRLRSSHTHACMVPL